MSTDTNDINPAAASSAAPSPDDTTAAVSTETEAIQTHACDDDRSQVEEPCSSEAVNPEQVTDEPCPGNEAPHVVAPAVAQTAWDDDWHEPGDDIGNRIDGPAHHERTTTEVESASAKRRGKRSKKNDAKDDASNPRGKQNPKAKANAPTRERPAFPVGEEVFGKVIEVLADAIFIDLSSKAKAIFDRHELSSDPPAAGDQFIATVHGDGARGGLVVLTHNPRRFENAKDVVSEALSSGELVNALVTGVIKGGVELDIDGLRAFAPGSHVDLRLGADLSYLVGQRLPFKVMKYEKNGKEVVLSRRELLEKEATQARQDGLAKLQIGSVVEATVRSVVEWGVFVAIPSANDIEGLIHISEASFERNAKLADLFKVGQSTEVKVLRVDDKGKLWLSRKAVTGDPWEASASQFPVGSRVAGRVVRMQPFGVFVELVPGVDGLIRTADLSLLRINDPSEVISIGDEINVVVVSCDIKQRKIALHPALPGDEQEPRQKIAPYRTVQIEVVSADVHGLTVRILGVTGASARGFIPAGHTNTARGTDLRVEYPAGTRLEAKIIDVDSKRGEVKLSIRALKEDTEKAAYQEYRTKVARESKFGTLGDLLAKRRSE
ncbi:MAG TPA: S1 RNA-binding domain-containing protein [Polyangiaceae bacterium]|jgi:small subunit ribosomal protein S1|nr:MAG: 30S ribosomal protein S1 [Deltaproteobacteria bacterium ADurb.Bin207]HNS99588.1 S1 RNA-binding domain-containing protein [Polyangiaceae bacterium]HNZ22520.1 S1 RNA-binding domain-containing protein [Polyangiaceae bacterium]HOD22740.1 S1 RNA-binding domain-containing protein [Polyangiaceae bacterium]HOE48526.1 S1 RNA-binding domain-containing protein [Polyangiaceae bacterium]